MLRNAALAALALGATALHLHPTTGSAARLFEPPLAELSRAHITVVEARAVEKSADAVTFVRLTRFPLQTRSAQTNGMKADDTVRVRMDDATLADVTKGETYVVSYTSVVNHPRRREEKLLDPDGPRVVSLRGFATDALFPATDDLRWLFSNPESAGNAQRNPAVVAALVRLLRSADQRTRTLAAGELFLNEAIRTSIDEEQAYRMGKAAPALSDELASYLVETLAALPQADTAGWLSNIARELIDRAGTTYDLASHRPRLVSESVQALAPGVSECDRARLTPLLRSNAPRVVESTIAALEQLDPAMAAQSVTDILDAAQWDDSLTAPVRRILEAYRVSVEISP